MMNRGRLRRSTTCLLAAAAGMPLASPALAQSPADSLPRAAIRAALGVAPETVSVGQRFRAYLQLAVPAGARLSFDPLAATDSVQQTDSVRVITARSGSAAGVYPLVAWVAGEPLRAAVAVRLVDAQGVETRYRVSLRLPVVRSVLPREGEIVPRPAKGQLHAPAGNELPWWALAAALAALSALLAWVSVRRRGRGALALDPRTDALARLDRLRAEGFPPALTHGDFYAHATRVLRDYLAQADRRLSEDLTTSELLDRLAFEADDRLGRAALERVLREADPVKFAGQLPPEDEAHRFWAAVRGWIAMYPIVPSARKEAA